MDPSSYPAKAPVQRHGTGAFLFQPLVPLLPNAGEVCGPRGHVARKQKTQTISGRRARPAFRAARPRSANCRACGYAATSRRGASDSAWASSTIGLPLRRKDEICRANAMRAKTNVLITELRTLNLLLDASLFRGSAQRCQLMRVCVLDPAPRVHDFPGGKRPHHHAGPSLIQAASRSSLKAV